MLRQSQVKALIIYSKLRIRIIFQKKSGRMKKQQNISLSVTNLDLNQLYSHYVSYVNCVHINGSLLVLLDAGKRFIHGAYNNCN